MNYLPLYNLTEVRKFPGCEDYLPDSFSATSGRCRGSSQIGVKVYSWDWVETIATGANVGQIITRDTWGLGYCFQFTYHKKHNTCMCIGAGGFECSRAVGAEWGHEEETEWPGHGTTRTTSYWGTAITILCLIVTLAHCIVTIGEDSFVVCSLILCWCRL